MRRGIGGLSELAQHVLQRERKELDPGRDLPGIDRNRQIDHSAHNTVMQQRE